MNDGDDYLHEVYSPESSDIPWVTRFTCWFSRKYWDIHDYKIRRGGDGTPSHFYTYKCWNCGKEFGI